MNWSPSPRPLSILLASSRVRSSTPCCCRMAECMSSACWASSCVEPPGGRITKYNATRLTTANVPRPSRISARGLFGGQTLKFLGIGHRDVIAKERIGLRRRRRRLHAGVSKLRGGFQALEQFQNGRDIFGTHHHIEQNLVVRIHLGKSYGNQPDIVGHHFFEIVENPGPTNGLALDERVQK